MMKRGILMLTAMTMMLMWPVAVSMAEADDPPPSRDEQRGDDGPTRDSWRGGDRSMMRGRFGSDGEGFRDRGRPGPHGDKEHGFDMTDEQVEQVFEVLEDYKPELADQIREMRQSDPRRADQLLRRAMMFVRPMLHMKRADPEGYELKLRDVKLDRESRELARRIHDADGREADKLRDELHDVVRAHFDVRQEMRERELVKLEERIAELRDQIEQRAASRGELCDERFGELVGESDDPEW